MKSIVLLSPPLSKSSRGCAHWGGHESELYGSIEDRCELSAFVIKAARGTHSTAMHTTRTHQRNSAATQIRPMQRQSEILRTSG